VVVEGGDGLDECPEVDVLLDLPVEGFDNRVLDRVTAIG